MAEAIAKQHAQEMNIKSAGVFAADGSPASTNTVEVLTEKGITIDHSAKLLTKELVDWANYIFTMTHSHKQLVMKQFPDSLPKVYTLKEFSLNQLGDVVDPFGGPIEVYRETYQELNESIQALVKQLEKDHNKF